MSGMLLMGKEGRAGLVVDCPGAMPFVRGIVGGVVCRVKPPASHERCEDVERVPTVG